ncbi:MAG: Lrp/AsnC family transcriptional regulator [Paracoccaceae bacterium]|jgi:Lrp/AsnC family transcriptional regulator|nr:Lrp/AsnC family transcriptional regulator [Paracoccaceae bacterium]|tara:strand:- start:19 stop:477 length:459 start_codon:yes stop_codon:yes gene_type:complete
MKKLDINDIKILKQLQKNASLSIEEISERISLSRNACWRRIRRLEDDGIINKRVAIVNAEALDLGQMVIVLISTNSHDPKWLSLFRAAITEMPEIMGAHRMSGDLDYILRVRVRDVRAYDKFYQRLISKVPISNVSASFVMEDLKDSTELPL